MLWNIYLLCSQIRGLLDSGGSLCHVVFCHSSVATAVKPNMASARQSCIILALTVMSLARFCSVMVVCAPPQRLTAQTHDGLMGTICYLD